MISQQELSAQQVASYLMGFEDHFTSHSYRNFYWTAFEAFINKELPRSQLADYQMRGDELRDTCVWDFISRVDKVKKTADNRKHKHNDSDEDADLANDFDEEADSDEKVLDDDAVEEEDEHSECSILQDDRRKRPRVQLRKGHEQAKTHILRVRAPDDSLVPVPIGPGIPRRDKEHLREKYCRLMLIFFKPWRHAYDLKQTHSSWEHAFNEFKRTCSQSVLSKMENMQILHEGRDSRDDHFAERR
ncbi:hypothetical protein B0H13DRAFT_1608051, partial [Mycena leptocephala]